MIGGCDFKFSCGTAFDTDTFLVLASSAGCNMHIPNNGGAKPTKYVILNQGFTWHEEFLPLGYDVQVLDWWIICQ